MLHSKLMLGFLGLVIILVYAFVYFNVRSTPEDPAEPTIPPEGTPAPSESVTDGGDQFRTLLRTGEQVAVRDFRQPEDTLDGETYTFAGGIDEVFPDFTLTYFEAYDYFQITINAEPIGDIRQQAETSLRATLGITEEQMCNLNAAVLTKNDVNRFYAGENLGISYCPGSVRLE